MTSDMQKKFGTAPLRTGRNLILSPTWNQFNSTTCNKPPMVYNKPPMVLRLALQAGCVVWWRVVMEGAGGLLRRITTQNLFDSQLTLRVKGQCYRMPLEARWRPIASDWNPIRIILHNNRIL